MIKWFLTRVPSLSRQMILENWISSFKEWIWTTIWHCTHILTQISWRLDDKTWNYKIKENISNKLLIYLNYSFGFDTKCKGNLRNNKQFGLHHTKASAQQSIFNKIRQPTRWEKLFANHKYEKGWYWKKINNTFNWIVKYKQLR